MTSVQEKAASRHNNNNNNIYQQLDLLYEFCQWALRRLRAQSHTAAQHLKLWRGSNQCEEQLIAGRLQNRRCTVRLNNLVSFSLSADDASCFGDWVFEVQVPICKVLVFPELLPGQVLQGEQEVLALGGAAAPPGCQSAGCAGCNPPSCGPSPIGLGTNPASARTLEDFGRTHRVCASLF